MFHLNYAGLNKEHLEIKQESDFFLLEMRILTSPWIAYAKEQKTSIDNYSNFDSLP